LVPIRGKECSTEQLPHLKQKFSSYQEFANANLFDIIGKNQTNGIKLQAETFASIILENTPSGFEIKELPVEAQFSVINGIVITDINDDGIKDIILGGNRFEVEIETTRSDASVGLVLLGSKTGEYQPLSYQDSGLFMPYNVKNLAKIKMANQSTGILVGVNNDFTRLFITSGK